MNKFTPFHHLHSPIQTQIPTYRYHKQLTYPTLFWSESHVTVSMLRTDQDTHAEQAIVKICFSTKDLKGSRRGSDADQLFTPHLDMTAYIWGMEMCLPSKVLAIIFCHYAFVQKYCHLVLF